MNLRPAWVEVDLSAVAHNFRAIRRITAPEAGIMAVVKANAYGHGALEVSRTVLGEGADGLAVAILNEARQLRDAGINAPILIFGYTPPEQLRQVVELAVSQTVFTWEAAKLLNEAAGSLNKTAKIHIKVDTGMARIGFAPDDASVDIIMRISKLPHLEIEGIWTHFAVADSREKDFTRMQYAFFNAFIEKLGQKGVRIPLKHICNSAGLIDLPEYHLDMVRPGICLYGLYPSDEVDKSKLHLKPAMSMKARVAFVKPVSAGTTVSYGRTFTVPRDTVVATIPLGYADGYTRAYSNKAQVLIRGKRAPVIGRVCMDQFMVDAGHIAGVAAGDEVVLMGRQGNEEITVDELAGLLGTINYEITCMVGARMPRIYEAR